MLTFCNISEAYLKVAARDANPCQIKTPYLENIRRLSAFQ